MRRTPTIVDALWALPVQQLAAGDRHSAALTSNGFLFTCGANDRGQLGLPTVAEVAAQNQACARATPSWAHLSSPMACAWRLYGVWFAYWRAARVARLSSVDALPRLLG